MPHASGFRIARLAALLAFSWSGLRASGAEPPRAPATDGRPPADVRTLAGDPAFRERLRAWQSMASGEKDRLRARFERWKSLPEADRLRLSANLTRFRRLPAEQQAELWKRFQGLPTEQRQKLQQLADRARSLAYRCQVPLNLFMDRLRDVPREEIDRLRRLPPEERRRAVQQWVRRFQDHVLGRIESHIPEGERASYRSLSFDEKLARARRWFAEREAREGGQERRHSIPRRAPP